MALICCSAHPESRAQCSFQRHWVFPAVRAPGAKLILISSSLALYNSDILSHKEDNNSALQQFLELVFIPQPEILISLHRMVWVERDFKNHLVPTSPPQAGTLPLAQVAQRTIQPGLEHLQLLWTAPSWCLTTLTWKKFLLISNLTLPAVCFKPSPPFSLTPDSCPSPSSALLEPL